MHQLESLRNRLPLTEESLSSNILILSQNAKCPSQKSVEHGTECAFRNQVRHRLRQLRSGPAHTTSSLHSIRQQQKRKEGCQCIHPHTHTDGGMGAQLNRVRERGSGGQVCKPHTTSRVTKVTKGMCMKLSPIPLSPPAVLSLQNGGKHSITQGALHNLFVSLRKENTV